MIKKIFRILNDTTAFALIAAAMGMGFVLGVFVERTNSNDKMRKMEFDLYKRKLGDFYYDEKGDMEYRWRKD